jgi:putative lipoprotein
MTSWRCMLAIGLALALSGCPEKKPDAAAAADAPASNSAIPTESNFIHGTATYLERIKIPPGADFTVQLIDNQLADTPQAVIAETTLEDVAGAPYNFSLMYDPAKIRANGQYGLHANLRGADGNLLFVTDTRVPVVPGDQKTVEFRMKRVSAGDAPAPPTDVRRSVWTCGDMTFEAAFDVPGERVELALPSGTVSLPLAQSASGARYGDHLGNEFWTKGDQGTLVRQGSSEKLDCIRQDTPPEAGSPWDRAKKRGIAFRAVGNEPGWLVEVGPGDAPKLHAELDYGGKQVDVAQAMSLSGLMGYAGKAADGTKVRLVLERRECNDGMSDAKYPVNAMLDVGGTTYRGCGRFLAE